MVSPVTMAVVDAGDAKGFRLAVQRIQHAAAAAEEKRVGLAERQRAAERRLEAHALLIHGDQSCERSMVSCASSLSVWPPVTR